MRYLFILFVLMGCAKDIKTPVHSFTIDPPITTVIDRHYTPVFPVPVHSNEFTDSTFITNQINFWKTTTSLNSKIPVHSGTCFVNGVWESVLENCHIAQNQGLNPPADTQPIQVYRVNIGQVQVGEVFEILSQFEITNDLDYPIMIADVVIASVNPNQTTNAVQDESIHDPILIPANGTNCLPDVHHCTETKVGAFMVDQSFKEYFGNQDVWITVLSWSNTSLNVLENNAFVRLEQNYGSLNVVKK